MSPALPIPPSASAATASKSQPASPHTLYTPHTPHTPRTPHAPHTPHIPHSPAAPLTPIAHDGAYPQGHLGYLNPAEEATFASFKQIARERGLYDPSGATPTHREEDLLRYLRARRWAVEDALKQLADTIAWRRANDIEVLYQTIELDAYEQSRRMYPQWTGRRDRRGIPLYVFDIKTLDSKTVHNYEKVGASITFSKARFGDKTASGLMRLNALYENLTRFAMPFCTQLPDRDHVRAPITIGTNIVDVSGVGLKQFWSLKGHMQAASQLATAYYPETLDRIYIVGAPFFFPTVWGWIKKWFDPITVSKIFILSEAEVTPTLTRFIDTANIPKQYGGQLDWKFGDMPTVDPAWEGVVEWAPGHSSFVSSPCVWREIEGGTRVECVGVGCVNGRERQERICTMPKAWPPSDPAHTNAMPAVSAATNGNAEASVASAAADTTPSVDEAVQTNNPRADVTFSSEGMQTDGSTLAQTPPNGKIGTNDKSKNTISTGEAIKNLLIGGKMPAGEKGAEEIPPAVPTTIA